MDQYVSSHSWWSPTHFIIVVLCYEVYYENTFVDHYSEHIFFENQLSLGAAQATFGKCAFEFLLSTFGCKALSSLYEGTQHQFGQELSFSTLDGT